MATTLNRIFVTILISLIIITGMGLGQSPIVRAATLINSTNLVSGVATNGGGCTGLTASRTELYCNGDNVYHTNNGFTTIPGRYRIDVDGSSNGSSSASADVLVGGVKVGVVNWTSSTRSIKSVTFDLSSGTGGRQVKFALSTDNGSSDTYLYKYDLYYESVPPTPKPPPSPVTTGAAITGVYRNLFKEWGKTDAEIDAKVNAA